MSEWNSVDWYSEEKKLIVLSDIDEGGSYEIDRALIGLDKQTGKFVLMVASGCSCWDGQGEMKLFDDLDSLEVEMNKVIDEELIKFPRMREYDKVSDFYLSVNGCKELISEAKKTFVEYVHKTWKENT